MKTLQATLLLLFSAASLPALADPVFDFTITGDGYTLQFSTANPPTVVEFPLGATILSLTSLTGALNGVGGYGYSAQLDVEDPAFQPFTINVNPLPPGITSAPANAAGDFSLYGTEFVTLVSDQPNPNPCSPFCPNDLQTFAFVPGVYTNYGYGPDAVRVGSYYTIDITQETPQVTPEPASLVLLLTGTAGLLGGLQKRRGVCKPCGTSSS